MWMRPIVFYIACISLCFKISVQAQSIEETYSMGIDAYKGGNLELAENYFHRVAYFSADSLRYLSYLHLGDIYSQKGDYQSAIRNYSYASSNNLDFAGREFLAMKKVRLWLAMHKYKLAYAETFNIPDTDSFREKKTLYQAFALFEAHNYRKSMELYKELVSAKDEIVLIQLFNEAHHVHGRSIKVYQFISYIIPGLGQALNAYYFDAFNSFILNAALVGVFIYTSATVGLIEGGIAVLPWLYRYYTGGAENAKRWAVQHKHAQLHNIHLQILDLVKKDTGL